MPSVRKQDLILVAIYIITVVSVVSYFKSLSGRVTELGSQVTEQDRKLNEQQIQIKQLFKVKKLHYNYKPNN